MVTTCVPPCACNVIKYVERLARHNFKKKPLMGIDTIFIVEAGGGGGGGGACDNFAQSMRKFLPLIP